MKFLSQLRKKFFSLGLSEDELERLFYSLHNKYPKGRDPWGLNLDHARDSLQFLWPFYKHYFRTRVLGPKELPDRPFIVISNHSGQVAIDGMLITIAFIADTKPPRILRPMVERFVVGMPFFGSWSAQSGAVLGDRENCLRLLEHGNSVLVFPEGLKGVAKDSSDYYQLKKFTRGFFRLAVQAGVDILPVAVVGAEEFYPYVKHARKTAKTLGLPVLPITPTFPWLGPLGAVPMPSPVDIHLGTPYQVPKHLSHHSPDKLIDEQVDILQKIIQGMIDQGLKKRRPFWANKPPRE